MCVFVCVCVGGGARCCVCVCGGGEEVLETKLFFRRGSAAKGGPTEKVGIPYL